MARVVQRTLIDDTHLSVLLQPRTDVVTERRLDGVDSEAGRFGPADGPFDHYLRTVVVHGTDPDGRHDTEEVTDFHLAVPIWGLLFVGLFKRAVRRRGVHGEAAAGPRFWEPPDRLDVRAATVLGLLCSVALVAGYLGTVLTQTVTFAAEQFGDDQTAQSATLAAVRVGVLGSLVLVALADRWGRRRLLLGTAVAGCLATSLGAVAPNLIALGLTQAVSRGFATAVVVLLTVVAAEEMPAGARAYAVSVMTLTGALGAGMAVWLLPVADLGPGAWRMLYVLPLVYLPLLAYVGKRLPESRRFEASHVEAPVAGHGGRLRLLAATFFLTSVFSQPASQLQNEFLRHDRGFSATTISLFILVTSTPGFLGIVIGGRLADTRGRRVVASVAVSVGALATVASFLSHGWLLWAWAAVGVLFGAAAVPSLGVYGPELFPTSLRGRANGVIQLVAVAGSSLGLLAAGVMAGHIGLGRAMAVLVIAPLLVGALVLVALPETAHLELEVLNPEDRSPEGSVA